jgi:hypothetical protein
MRARHILEFAQRARDPISSIRSCLLVPSIVQDTSGMKKVHISGWRKLNCMVGSLGQNING